MSRETYIGGAFATNDSRNFRLSEGETTNFFNDLPAPIGFETGAEALAWILLQELQDTIRPVYFPFHYCEETIHRIRLKVPGLQLLHYENAEHIETPAIVVWNHFNGHLPIPDSLLNNNIALIEDCVQSLSSLKKTVGKASFTSLRKWLEEDLAPVFGPYEHPSTPFGRSAYYTTKKIAEQQKERWKKGEITDENTFLNTFETAENQLQVNEIHASDTSRLKQYDWEKIITYRNQNSNALRQLITHLNIDILSQDELFLMIRLDNRDVVRKELAKQGIFAPVHWLDSADKQQAKTLLSLPIDQRYDKEDMTRIASALEHGINVASL